MKLFNLKQWLSIEDTASYLSSIFDEPVKNHDVFRLALDGHLKLSLNFVNHVSAKKGKRLCYADAEKIIMPDLRDKTKTLEIVLGLKIYKDNSNEIHEVIQFDEDLITLSGIWDLCMFANGSLDIEKRYQKLTNGAQVDMLSLDGCYVENSKGVVYELQETILNDSKSLKDDSNYFPAGKLPKDADLVVRTVAISEFIELATNNKNEKSLSNKERETLLIIIAALAKEARVDITKISKSGDHIANMTQMMGCPVGATTIETHLKKIPVALESRAK